ncbi:hypothetical protein DFJ73DRAFT_958841, partial [Zopfochytrium polystomum]
VSTGAAAAGPASAPSYNSNSLYQPSTAAATSSYNKTSDFTYPPEESVTVTVQTTAVYKLQGRAPPKKKKSRVLIIAIVAAIAIVVVGVVVAVVVVVTRKSSASPPFQIRLRGTTNCIAGAALESCEATPSVSSSKQLFVSDGPTWKQISSGGCLSFFGGVGFLPIDLTRPQIEIVPCNGYNAFQEITYLVLHIFGTFGSGIAHWADLGIDLI